MSGAQNRPAPAPKAKAAPTASHCSFLNGFISHESLSGQRLLRSGSITSTTPVPFREYCSFSSSSSVPGILTSFPPRTDTLSLHSTATHPPDIMVATCKECKLETESRAALVAHWSEQRDKGNRHYHCSLCMRLFSTPEGEDRHQREVNQPRSRPRNTQPTLTRRFQVSPGPAGPALPWLQ